MTYIDTHCHLNLDIYKNNIDQVIDQALEAGVTHIIVPGLDIKTSLQAIEIASRYQSVYAAIGIHPTEVQNQDVESVSILEQMMLEKKVVAIGEIGLDYYHSQETKLDQIKMLDSMLELALKYSKPVILHSRNAMDDMIQIVKNRFGVPLKKDQCSGVFHSFEGSAEQARTVTAMNFMIGIGGSYTFKNAKEKQQVLKELGIENVILETDSPFQSPHPFRGTQNEPSRIGIIAQKIAEIIDEPLPYVSEITTKNAFTLFKLGLIN